MSGTEKLLFELIALPSVNPAFSAGDATQTGEERVAEFLAATAACAGLDVAFAEVFPNRPNLLVTLSPRGKLKKRIVLAPHLDTVGPSSEKSFSPEKRGGRIYGRGACDTKGSVASFFTALTTLAKSGQRPENTEIVFVGLADEEYGQHGSRTLARNGFKADFAIIGEPTRLQVVTAHKGSVWLWLETHGKAAHSSKPHLGQNAIHEMAKIVDLLQTTYTSQLKRGKHALLGHRTVSVGSINGGTQPNIVPALCKASLDRRTLPGETEASVRSEILSLLRKNNLKATVSTGKEAPCPPMETNPNLPLVQQFLASAGCKKPVGVDYFTDAAVLAGAGTPGIVFGPGDIAQAHTQDEWISSRELEKSTAIIRRFLQSLP